MNMKKLIAGIFACMLMFTMCLTGCGNNEEAKDKDKDHQQQQNQDENNKDDNNEQKLQLKVGTNAEFPPFEYMNDNGEIDGVDMALMKEIAKRLNAEITIESMQFNGLIGAISSGQINCIAAGYTIDEERKLACDFSDPYKNSEQVVIVRKGTEGIASMDDLKGKTIA